MPSASGILSTDCDGCGAPFTTSHALDCMKGGLIVQRHNEIRDLLFDLLSIVYCLESHCEGACCPRRRP